MMPLRPANTRPIAGAVRARGLDDAGGAGVDDGGDAAGLGVERVGSGHDRAVILQVPRNAAFQLRNAAMHASRTPSTVPRPFTLR